jgi:hypothetical protein
MSSGNWFETKRKAFDLRTKEITTSSTVTVYTSRAGGSAHGFVEDRVINVITSSGNDLTITVSNGSYEGQRILITFLTEGSDETVTVTVTTGSNYSLTAANDYCSLEWINANVGWIALSEVTT